MEGEGFIQGASSCGDASTPFCQISPAALLRKTENTELCSLTYFCMYHFAPFCVVIDQMQVWRLSYPLQRHAESSISWSLLSYTLSCPTWLGSDARAPCHTVPSQYLPVFPMVSPCSPRCPWSVFLRGQHSAPFGEQMQSWLERGPQSGNERCAPVCELAHMSFCSLIPSA